MTGLDGTTVYRGESDQPPMALWQVWPAVQVHVLDHGIICAVGALPTIADGSSGGRRVASLQRLQWPTVVARVARLRGLTDVGPLPWLARQCVGHAVANDHEALDRQLYPPSRCSAWLHIRCSLNGWQVGARSVVKWHWDDRRRPV